MLAKKYRSKVISVVNPYDGMYTLKFESCKRAFKYQPGQFLHLAIDEEYDGIGQWPQSRCFSMQSNPSDKNIKITYSVKGAFTAEMKEKLKVGSEIWLKLPYGGLFQQNHSKENTVFIAGGTGIAPFLSLFTDDSFSEYESPKVYMGFRNRLLQKYELELELAKTKNPSASFKSFFQNEDGIIDIASILSENTTYSTYFISGPPLMIKNFKSYLRTHGVKDNLIITDDWE
jgi:NAD(P)H-flavin reductase